MWPLPMWVSCVRLSSRFALVVHSPSVSIRVVRKVAEVTLVATCLCQVWGLTKPVTDNYLYNFSRCGSFMRWFEWIILLIMLKKSICKLVVYVPLTRAQMGALLPFCVMRALGLEPLWPLKSPCVTGPFSQR